MASCRGMKPGMGVMMVKTSFFFSMLDILNLSVSDSLLCRDAFYAARRGPGTMRECESGEDDKSTMSFMKWSGSWSQNVDATGWKSPTDLNFVPT